MTDKTGASNWMFASMANKAKGGGQPFYPPAKTQFAGGGMRDSVEGKERFDLLYPARQPYQHQILTRFADWMRRGAEKYAARNWEEFSDGAALEHAKASLGRHYAKYMAGETDEDHAAAIFFNVMCIEYVQQRIGGEW